MKNNIVGGFLSILIGTSLLRIEEDELKRVIEDYLEKCNSQVNKKVYKE